MGSSSGGSSGSKRSSTATKVANTVMGSTPLGTVAKTLYNGVNTSIGKIQSAQNTPGSISGSTPSYAEHIQYFGNSPAAYAGAIRDAEVSGRALSDPTSAAAFKRDHPEYFNDPLTQTPTPTIQAAEPLQPYDPTQYINELKEAQRASRIASLDKARSAALSSLDTEKANVAPTYYDKRNQAAAASDVGAMNFAQYMAARGIKGMAGAMPEIYRNAGLQGQIGALDRQEAANLAAIENQRANINTGYESDVAAANADVESQAMQSLINQWNTDRSYQLQQAAADLDRQQFDWSKSPSNPTYQASIAAARAAELENSAREIQNSYLPETLKLQAERLAQQVRVGSLDYDTALAQLNQIKAQTANYGRSGGSGGLTPYQQYQTGQNTIKNSQWIENEASARAKADPRLADVAHPADGVNRFTLPQLIDAWRRELQAQINGGGGGDTYSDDELLNLL